MFPTCCLTAPSRPTCFVRLRSLWPVWIASSLLLGIVVAVALAPSLRTSLLIACVAAIGYFTVTMIYQAITLRPATLLGVQAADALFGNR